MRLEMPNRTWLPVCALLLACWLHVCTGESRVVCYYTNWSVYRPGTAKFNPQNINPYLCTHLIYAFGGFTKENSLKPFDKYQDIEKGGYAKFTGLKTYNKNLKTMLAIGGWNEGSSRFSPMVASADRRKELVKNSIKFLRQNHFDGLDLDWEYPSFRDGGKPRDRDNYAQLVQELKEEFDRESQKTGRPRLLLTMAVPAGVEYINKGYDIPKLTRYLDWMNILSYDYHSSFEPAVNHHSPLFSLEEDNEYNYDTDLNINHTIKHYLEAGAERSKLVLGIPTYGRSYTLFNPDANELGAPADGPGDMGEATRENGYLAYYEICENVKANGWKVIQPNPKAMGPYAYKENQWVGYDDESIVRRKAEYVVDQGLGGIMFWAIDNDDFRGNCHGKPYPLIEAAKEALMTAAGRTDNNLLSNSVQTSRPRTRTRGRTTARPDAASRAVQNSGGRQSIASEDDNTNRKRIRIGSKFKVRDEQEEEKKPVTRTRTSTRRRRPTTTTTTVSTTPSTLPTTPSYRTPEPPTTPDPGSDFKCEDEGFFPHPRDCKKYFWCLSSGPSDLGIVAHQFTCPSGLYFNKAADSCDYTQNVLCNKKLSRTTAAPTTSASTTTTTTVAPSTSRKPPKITAATSRTTFLYTTPSTTEAPEYEEYEYDDEEDKPVDSEEDPKVIKELIDLIKKAGGVEELERYLKLQDNGEVTVTHSDSTTPSTISRSLYERVLSRAQGGNSKSADTKPTYTALNRNSRPGPQNEGLNTVKETDVPSRRGRPQYTTITRQRASTERSVSEDELEEEILEEVSERPSSRQSSVRKNSYPEYVNIRRARPATIQEEEVSTRTSYNRQRFPSSEEEKEIDAPEYVTIRRTRPTTEETTASKYSTILRRRPTTETDEKLLETTKTPEVTSTAAATEGKTNSETTNIVSTTAQVTTKSTVADTRTTAAPIGYQEDTTPREETTETKDRPVLLTDKTNQIDGETERPTTPQLFRPRPFTTRARSTTPKPSEPPSEVTKKVSFARPIVRKVAAGNRAQPPSAPETEDADSRHSVSRGTARFRFTTTTSTEPSAVKRPSEYEYDYDDQYQRTFRPSHIEDLSSLTSADINVAQNHHRRPAALEAPAAAADEPELKTISRTAPPARKLAAESIETRTNRRLPRPKPEIALINDLSAKNTHIVRRPNYVSLTRTTTAATDDLDVDLVAERTGSPSPVPFSLSTESSLKLTVADNELLHTHTDYQTAKPDSTTEESSTTNNELKTDSETNELSNTVTDFVSTTNLLEDQPSVTTEINSPSTLVSRGRFRPTTTLKIENEPVTQRGRIPFVLLRNQTRQRATNEQTGTVSKIRPVILRSRNAEDEAIKLSESNVRINDNLSRSRNLPEENTEKPRVRKIIRKLRPTKINEDVKEIISDSQVKLDVSQVQAVNRRRKVIRKLRPVTTTESVPLTPDTTTVEATSEEMILSTSESTTTDQSEQDTTTDVITTEISPEPITTTTTTPRPTRPYILNKPRPVYRPKSRLRDLQTSTTTTTQRSRRRFGSFNRAEAEIEEPEVKKLNDKRLRYKPVSRTTERIRTTEAVEEKEPEEIATTEQMEITTIGDLITGNFYTVTLNSRINEIEPTEINTENTPQIDMSTTLLDDIEYSTTFSGAPETTSVTDSTELDIFTTETSTDEMVTDESTPTETDTTITMEITTVATMSSEQAQQSTDQTTVPASTVTPELIRTTPEITSTEASKRNKTSAPSKFVPSTITSKRNRLPFRKGPSKPTEPPAPSSEATVRKFVPTARKIQGPRFTFNADRTDKKEEVIVEDKVIIETPEIEYEEDKEVNVEEDARKSNIPVDSRVKKPPNRPVYVPKRPNGNVPFVGRFNKPAQPQTTETLLGIDIKAVNERNKNLFNKNRKMNVPTVVSTTAKQETVEIKEEPAQVTEETGFESTTEQMSTLHHVFAELDSTTEINAQQSVEDLEKLIEVNRIVEVSLKEDKVKNSSGLVESRYKQEEPTLDRVGAINRLTIIKVVDGDGAAMEHSLPANHAPPGQRLEIHAEPANVEAHLHAPDIQTTKQNILNNTLQIIDALTRQGYVSGPVTVGEGRDLAGDELARFLPLGRQTLSFSREVAAGDGAPGVSKIEIYSRSNVIDYSHRVQDPAEAIRAARLRANGDAGPVFTDATTISLEGLFSVTELPTLKEVVTARGENAVDDLHPDLDQSHSTNGRVRIRILGQEPADGRSLEAASDPLAPIKLLGQEPVTLRADVVEVAPAPDQIRIVPAAVEKPTARPAFLRRPGSGRNATAGTNGTSSGPFPARPTRILRRKLTPAPRTEQTATASSRTTPSQVSQSTLSSKYKFFRRKSVLKTTKQPAVEDQIIESNIQKTVSREKIKAADEGSDEVTVLAEVDDIALTLRDLNNAPLPTTRTSVTQKPVALDRFKTRARISTTIAPRTTQALTFKETTQRSRVTQIPQPFEKVTVNTRTYRPVNDYDYYDDDYARVYGELPANSKVLIHSSTGAIQCLDQGNFPHPVSCKKFIYCAKMENGEVVGWEYTCPNKLSFDPIGGICNWSAGLGCHN